MNLLTRRKIMHSVVKRRKIDLALHLLFVACTSIGVIVLFVLLIDIIIDGIGNLRPELFNNFPSRRADRKPA